MSAPNSGSRHERNIYFIMGAIMVVSITMAPLTYGLSFVLLFFAIFVCIVARISMNQIQNRQRILSDALAVAETYGYVPNNDGSSVDIVEEHYTFPKICPHCLVELRLDEVKWVDPKSAICSNCESIINVGEN